MQIKSNATFATVSAYSFFELAYTEGICFSNLVFQLKIIRNNPREMWEVSWSQIWTCDETNAFYFTETEITRLNRGNKNSWNPILGIWLSVVKFPELICCSEGSFSD